MQDTGYQMPDTRCPDAQMPVLKPYWIFHHSYQPSLLDPARFLCPAYASYFGAGLCFAKVLAYRVP